MQNLDEHKRLLSEEAKGNAEAQFQLGLGYIEKKQATQQDYIDAIHYFEKAIQKEHAGAQFQLGLLYYNGQGVKKDYAKATDYFREAATRGNAGAKNWFREVAESGDAEAQCFLGDLYYDGDGIPRSKIHAHMWWNIAYANGFKDAGGNLKMINDEITPEGIEKAQAMAVEMVEANPNLIKSQ